MICFKYIYLIYKVMKNILNKVPEITLIFWILKIISTTVWETAADYLSFTLGIWSMNTMYIVLWLLAIALWFQFGLKKYIPSIYRIVVILMSIAGTLITDNLVNIYGVNVLTTSVVFGVILVILFGLRYHKEKTLSIKEINTPTREIYYRLVVLFAFALGTSAWDYISENLWLWYMRSAIMYWWLVILSYILYKVNKIGLVLSFWIVYILTRPFGASIWDLLIQPVGSLWIWGQWWLWISAPIINIIFSSFIVILLIYLSIIPKKLANS